MMRARTLARYGLALTLALTSMRTATAAFAPPVFIPIEGGGGSPVAIATGDVNRDGHPDLVTANRASRNVSVLLGDGTRRFHRAPTTFPAGDWPSAQALGDVDGDGWLDLVIARATSPVVTVLLGGPDAAFVPAAGSPVAIGIDGGAKALALADFDGDGRLDLIAAGSATSILRGDGAGGFTRVPSPGSPSGDDLSSLVVADVNGDGRLDLVTVDTNRYSSASKATVTTFLGLGGFAFAPASGAPLSLQLPLSAAALGDVDRDGRLDLVGLDPFGGRLATLLGDGQGGFRLASEMPLAGIAPSAIALVDANHDGVLDLAVTDAVSCDVAIRLGNVSGGFIEPSDPPAAVGVDVEAVATGDLDGDGRPDIVTANHSNRTLTLLRQDAGGGFVPMADSPFPVDLAPAFVALGPELEGRSREILIRDWDGYVSVLRFDAGGALRPAALPPLHIAARGFATADLDGDGWLDLVATGPELVVLLGDRNGSFAAAARDELTPRSPGSVGGGASPPNAATEGSPIPLDSDGLFLGDVNGDGRPDIVTTNAAGETITVLLGNGRGRFAPVAGAPYSVGIHATLVTGGDVNGDGIVDLIAYDETTDFMPMIAVLLGDGLGRFSPAAGSPYSIGFLWSPPGAQGLIASDVNADGLADLVIHGAGIFVGIGTGSGGFWFQDFHPPTDYGVATAPTYPATPGTRSSVSVTDLDRDGKPDLVIGDGAASRVALLYNSWRAPASVSALSGTPQDCAVLSGFRAPLRALVRDAAGVPVPDVVVSFVMPTDGAGGQFGLIRSKTDAQGIASISVQANGTAGTYTVTASAPPFPATSATFLLTNEEVWIVGGRVSASRGSSARHSIGDIAGRGALTVTTSPSAPWLVASEYSRSPWMNEVTAILTVACDAPLGSNRVALTVSDGVHSATSDLVVEVSTDVIKVTPPIPAEVLVTQSTCSGRDGASLATLQARHPLEALDLRRLLESPDVTAYDTCTSHPTRLPNELIGPGAHDDDIDERTVFPIGTSLVKFSFQDEQSTVAWSYGAVKVGRAGDLDSIGGVNVSDVVILASYLVGNVEPGTAPFLARLPAADVNADGVVDVFDLLLVAGYIVGNVACLAP